MVNSYDLCDGVCIDLTRRTLILITVGTKRIKWRTDIKYVALISSADYGISGTAVGVQIRINWRTLCSRMYLYVILVCITRG